MQPFSIVHDFPGSPGDFWALFFDDAFNHAFYDSVDIDFQILRETQDGKRLERVVQYRSRQPVPSLMRPFLPEGLGYTEHGVFDAEGQTFQHRIEPSAFGSRTDIRGTLRVEGLSHGQIRRTYAGTVSIRAPLLGAKLEVDTIANMTRSQDVAAKVTHAWLARRREHGGVA